MCLEFGGNYSAKISLNTTKEDKTHQGKAFYMIFRHKALGEIECEQTYGDNEMNPDHIRMVKVTMI